MTWYRIAPVIAVVILAALVAWLPATAMAQTPAAAGPSNLTAVSGPEPGEVTLSWTPATGAVLNWIWSMKLNGTDYRWHLADGDAGSLVVGGLDAGDPHQFIVIAIYPPANPNAPARWRFSNFASATPKVAPPPVNTAQAIAAGGMHTCMLQADGTAACWGANGDADQGQADPPAGVVFTAITAGYEHTCALTAAGNARCWGDNSAGQSAAPAGVTFSHIDAGRAHTCALRDNGTALCWGSNEHGQRNAPAGVSFTAITAGGDHSCGLRADGRVQCWGDNYYRQSTPPDARFYSVSAGKWHTCGIKRDGSIACWGANPDGQAPAEVEGELSGD